MAAETEGTLPWVDVLLEREADWSARIAIPRSVHDLGDVAMDARSVLEDTEELSTGDSLIVTQVEYHPDGTRTLLVPLDLQSISFTAKDGESRLTVLGSTKSIETRYGPIAHVPRAPVRTLAQDWLNDAKRTESTRFARASALRELLSALGPNVLVSEIDHQKVLKVVERLEARDLARNTIRSQIAHLASLWRFLGSAFAFRFNPFEGLSKAVSGRHARLPDKRPFTTQEIVVLLRGDSRSPWQTAIRAALAVSLWTGARAAEVLALESKQLEETPEATWWSIDKSKTLAGIRRIPVTHPIARELIRQWARWPHPGSSALSASFAQYRQRVGIDGADVDFHSARRTAASVLERAGGHAVGVCRFVGHRPTHITYQRYSVRPSDRVLRGVATLLRYPAAAEAELGVLVSALRKDPIPASFKRLKMPPRRSGPDIIFGQWVAE